MCVVVIMIGEKNQGLLLNPDRFFRHTFRRLSLREEFTNTKLYGHSESPLNKASVQLPMQRNMEGKIRR
jgi:hypothetical protein